MEILKAVCMFYPSDLSDAEWEMIEPLLPADKPIGRPLEVHLRDVLDAIFYRVDNGIKWRAMPLDCILEISPRLGTGFVVEPWRWIVERTFTWLNNARALCRDYDELPEHHEGMVYVAMIRLMLRRLGNNRRTRKPKNT
jgi:transposase